MKKYNLFKKINPFLLVSLLLTSLPYTTVLSTEVDAVTQEVLDETEEVDEEMIDEHTSLKIEYDQKSQELRVYGLEIPAVGIELTLLLREEISQLPTFAPFLSIDYSLVKESSSHSFTIYVAGNHSLNDGANFALGTLDLHQGTLVDTIQLKAVDFLLQEVSYSNMELHVVDEEESDEDEDTQDEEDESEDSEENENDDVDDEDNDDVEDDEDLAQRYEDILAQYTDIAGHWAEERILFVIDRGYFAGVSDREFNPNATMTRGMFVTVLGNVADMDSDTVYPSDFWDVNTNDWYYPYVGWAVEHGVASGMGDDTFAPNQSITREQLAVMLLQFMTMLEVELPLSQQTDSFADHDSISEWAVNAVYYMQSRGLITGKEYQMFDPQGQATRGEVATVLHNFVKQIENPISPAG